jgi:rubrerythrin
VASTYDICERAERVELAAAAIYGALAERFRHDPDAHALFARLEAEELQHASRVRLLAARYRHDSKLLERASGDLGQLDRILAECQAVIAAVNTGTWGQDLAEVKRNLAALEDRLAEAHADLIARAGHPELRRFFELLARQDEAHVRLLVAPTGDDRPR